MNCWNLSVAAFTDCGIQGTWTILQTSLRLSAHPSGELQLTFLFLFSDECSCANVIWSVLKFWFLNVSLLFQLTKQEEEELEKAGIVLKKDKKSLEEHLEVTYFHWHLSQRDLTCSTPTRIYCYRNDKTFRPLLLQDMQKADIDTWENIRGPRPWEDSQQDMQANRQKMIEMKAKRSKTQNLDQETSSKDIGTWTVTTLFWCCQTLTWKVQS